MAQHLQHMLSQWYPARDQCRWVLGTVIDVQGSNYRKTGAMILVNEFGQYHGLISGGCLEKNLLNEVKKVLSYDRPSQVVYDSSEQGDAPWAVALGCGGRVTILLQPVNSANHYHQLDLLFLALQKREPVSYAIHVGESLAVAKNILLSIRDVQSLGADITQTGIHTNSQGEELLVVAVKAQVHLLVFGGGLDAIPLVNMANILGWKITLVDSRSGYALADNFPHAQIFRLAADSIELREILHCIDAAILMTHNLDMDAAALQSLQHSSARYIGLLGPVHRKQKVFKKANLDQVSAPVFGPMGLDIGGDLPESIALATLAECHQMLNARALNTNACFTVNSNANLRVAT